MLMKLGDVVAIEEALGSPDGYAYEQARADVESLLADDDALRQELAKAYRCIRGMYEAYAHGVLPGDTMMAYHSLTIGAAVRYVETGDLDGSGYFVGKKLDVLQQVLRSVKVEDATER